MISLCFLFCYFCPFFFLFFSSPCKRMDGSCSCILWGWWFFPSLAKSSTAVPKKQRQEHRQASEAEKQAEAEAEAEARPSSKRQEARGKKQEAGCKSGLIILLALIFSSTIVIFNNLLRFTTSLSVIWILALPRKSIHFYRICTRRRLLTFYVTAQLGFGCPSRHDKE